MEEYKLGYGDSSRKSREDDLNMALRPVGEAMEAKEYKKALTLLDKVMIEKPAGKLIQTGLKFSILLKINQQKAITYAEVNQQELILEPDYILYLVDKENGLEKSTYLWAAKNYANSKPEKETSPAALDLLASCYAKGGNYKSAIAAEEKAIKAAKTALKEGKFVDAITDNTVTAYEEALLKYQKAMKKKPVKKEKK